jgi:hypothetical protein
MKNEEIDSYDKYKANIQELVINVKLTIGLNLPQLLGKISNSALHEG